MYTFGLGICRPAAVAALMMGLVGAAVAAPSEGGLYIAGAGFSFEAAAQRALAQNPGGRRFFLLSLPPETQSLYATAAAARAAARERVAAGNGVLLVCQRDIDRRKVDAASLVPGVVPVLGWPPKGSNQLPSGQRYFADEDPANLPASNEALRRLRSSCS